jgi:hypothetical protein
MGITRKIFNNLSHGSSLGWLKILRQNRIKLLKSKQKTLLFTP